jgi:hypothetical protein
VKLFEVFDRAHFPTVDTEAGRSQTDRVPLPLFMPAAEAHRPELSLNAGD